MFAVKEASKHNMALSLPTHRHGNVHIHVYGGTISTEDTVDREA